MERKLEVGWVVLLVFAATAVWAAGSAVPPALMWDVRAGTGGQARDLGLDQEALYLLSDAVTIGGFITTKMDRDGRIIWQNPYGGSTYACGLAVAADGLGNVYAAGNGKPSPSSAGTLILKYNRDGELLYSIASPAGGAVATAIAACRAGVYVASRVGGTVAGGDFGIARLDGAGRLQWYQTYDGGVDQPVMVGVDCGGRAFLLGNSNTGTGRCVRAFCYNCEGGLHWQNAYTNVDQYQAVGGAIAAGTCPFALVQTVPGSACQAWRILRFCDDGGLAWDWGAGQGSALGLAADGSFDVYASYVTTGTTPQTRLVKFSMCGGREWEIVLDPGQDFVARELAVDDRGFLVVAGTQSTYGRLETRVQRYQQFLRIQGKVVNGERRGVSGVTVTLSGARTATALTDAQGRYAFEGLPCGEAYEVAAAKDHWVLSPAARSIPLLASTQYDVSFAGYELGVGEDAPQVTASIAPVPSFLRSRVELQVVVPTPGHALVRVLSAAGAQVRLIAQGTVSAGRHSFTWDGTDDRGQRLPAGAYFCELVTDQARRTGKILIVN